MIGHKQHLALLNSAPGYWCKIHLVDVVVHNMQYLVPISGNEVTVQFPPGDIRGVHESAVIQT
jgi:hypothetical protein